MKNLNVTLKVVQGDCLSPKGGTRNRFIAFCLKVYIFINKPGTGTGQASDGIQGHYADKAVSR